MRASRLVSILMLLQAKGRQSARVLADELHVSMRTIYRDVDALSASGVPVVVEHGAGGGFTLMDGWRTRLTGLTPDEAQAMLLSGLPGPTSQLGLGEAVTSARLKLLAALPAGWQDDAQRISSRFHLDPVPWYRKASRVEHLAGVANSVWTARRIVIRYDSWKADVARTVEPLGVVLKGGDWYLVASAKGSVRTYRVSNIRELELLSEHFARPNHFDLAAFWANSTARFEREIYKDTAELLVTTRGQKLLRESAAAVVAALDQCKSKPDRRGRVRVVIPIESIEHAERELLRLGAEVEVLQPRALRRRLTATLKRMHALYE